MPPRITIGKNGFSPKKQEEINKPAETAGVYYSADVKNKDYYLEHNINPYEWNGWRFFGTVTSNGLEIFVSLTAILTVSGLFLKSLPLGRLSLSLQARTEDGGF